MSRALFNRLYRSLNPDQRKAVDEIEGPVFVIAGPGTGKTQVLTLRIANILLKTDTPPDAILALTFTRSGVFSMRQRLSEIIGSGAYRVRLHTFHGFCQQVIRDYPDDFPHLMGATPATLLDQLKILRQILAHQSWPTLRPAGNPDHYLLSMIAEIDRLKRENVTPTALKKLLAEAARELKSTPGIYHESGRYAGQLKGKYEKMFRRQAKNEELSKVYGQYETALRERNLYDFGDMIMEVLKALRQNKNLLTRLQEEHQYLLADEHQDANQSQNELLDRLSSFHPSPNLFIVGDEKQAIFQFQGASLDNFNYFKRRFPEAKLITLRENYRSPQRVLDAAWSLLSSSHGLTEQSHPKLRARPPRRRSRSRPTSGQVGVYGFSTTDFEINFLVEEISKLIKGGVRPEEIAIIYRRNKDSEPVAAALERAQIDYSIEAEENALADKTVNNFLILLRSLAEFGRDEFLAPALWLNFLKLPPWPVHQAIARARASKRSILLELARAPEAPLRRLAANFQTWLTWSKNEPLESFFERLLRESGLTAHLLRQPDAQRQLEKFRALFNQARNLSTSRHHLALPEFISYLDLLIQNGIRVGSNLRAPATGLRLLTAHKSKGREFEHVFIVNADDNHWGGGRARRDFLLPLRGLEPEDDEIESERRLFYVALTRAKLRAVITYARLSPDGEERSPSRFLAEIGSSHLKPMPVAALESAYEQAPPDYLRPRQAPGPRVDDRAYLRQLFLDQGLSVTALNNYLDCPWKYFFQNLLRLPSAKSGPLIFGTAVHTALRRFFARRQEGRPATRAYLLKNFSTLIKREALPPADLKTYHKRGLTALGGYYEARRREWLPTLQNEFFLRGVKLAPEIKLTGAIDKIESLAGDLCRVVDYKTGRPRSRREILGEVKSSSGHYYRQLLFYKLLLERSSSLSYRVADGMIDFVEPSSTGRYRQEVFDLPDSAVSQLESEIKKAADEILTLAFWRRRCGDQACQFCRLRDAIRR